MIFRPLGSGWTGTPAAAGPAPTAAGGLCRDEMPRDALVEPVSELGAGVEPLRAQQQRQLGELGVLRGDWLTGERGVDRVECGRDLGIEGVYVKRSHHT